MGKDNGKELKDWLVTFWDVEGNNETVSERIQATAVTVADDGALLCWHGEEVRKVENWYAAVRKDE